MSFPADPFLKDAEGAGRFCRDLLSRLRKPKTVAIDFSPAIRWSARCAAHWAERSKAWARLQSESQLCDTESPT